MLTLQQAFRERFGSEPERTFFAPGRLELAGNHTDHQHGCVIAAAVTDGMHAAVRCSSAPEIRLFSEGFGEAAVSLSDTAPRDNERGTAAALVRGVLEGFLLRGARIGGLDIYVRSSLIPGGGFSSSAAFEVLLARCLDGMFRLGLTPTELAVIAQRAENLHYGKPCGLMDQLACAGSGISFMDFAAEGVPQLTRIDFDFAAAGYTLCLVDSFSDHCGSTHDYASIAREMTSVAQFFGKKYLREVPESMLLPALARLREETGDRAVLRALHFFGENRRVIAQAKALAAGDTDEFLRLVTESGQSSWTYLQNVVTPGAAYIQRLSLTLAVCRELLGGRGAVRVHGGGFGGCALAFVPNELLPEFRAGIRSALGQGALREVTIA